VTKVGASQEGSLPATIAIVGPTAIGKSRFAMRLASEIPAEIISADSRQVYRFLDIGTAKPTTGDRALVPHHLVDVVTPDETYSVGRFRGDALEALGSIAARDRVALVVGGSGHYVRTLLAGLTLPPAPPDPSVRAAVEIRMQREGLAGLMDSIARVDPATANRLDTSNTRRVIRALEIIESTGGPIPRVQSNPIPALRIGLTMERRLLYDVADRRVEAQFEDGLVDELRRVLAMGYDAELAPLRGLAYRQAADYLSRRVDLRDAIQAYKYATHNLIRRQETWFRREPQLIRVDVNSRQAWDDIRRLTHDYLSLEGQQSAGIQMPRC